MKNMSTVDDFIKGVLNFVIEDWQTLDHHALKQRIETMIHEHRNNIHMRPILQVVLDRFNNKDIQIPEIDAFAHAICVMYPSDTQLTNMLFEPEGDELIKIQSDHYYRYGSDENVISMIKSIADRELFDCKFVDVVINPSSNSIFVMSLIHHYKFMFSVSTKQKVERLNDIYKSITICKDAFNDLSYQISLLELNKLSNQNFLDKALDEIKILLDGQSQHSFFATLKNEFKPDL